jgi:ABC-type transport system substrate-binding protein
MPSLRGRTQNLRAGMATSIGLVCLFCFVCLAAGGCGRKGDVPATGSAAGSAAPGGTAVVALAADPDVLNPLIYSSTIAGIVIAELHDGLADMDENLSYVPRIARGWESRA